LQQHINDFGFDQKPTVRIDGPAPEYQYFLSTNQAPEERFVYQLNFSNMMSLPASDGKPFHHWLNPKGYLFSEYPLETLERIEEYQFFNYITRTTVSRIATLACNTLQLDRLIKSMVFVPPLQKLKIQLEVKCHG
jgi:hypothetical protein